MCRHDTFFRCFTAKRMLFSCSCPTSKSFPMALLSTKRLNSDHAGLKYSKARNKLTSALRIATAQCFENLSTAIRYPLDFRASYHKLSPKRLLIFNTTLIQLLLPSTSTELWQFSTNFSSSTFYLSVLTFLYPRQTDLAIFSQTLVVPRRRFLICCPHIS